MEHGLGSENLDRSRVLNVQPLRCLKPMFPPSSGMSPQSASFVGAPPTGPFPPGVASFFPFLSQNGSFHQAKPFDVNPTVQSPDPISSFRTPVSQNGNGYPMNLGNGNGSTPKIGRPKGSKKKMKHSHIGDDDAVDVVDMEVLANSFLSSYDLTRFDSSRLDDVDKETVDCVLMMFDLLRRKITQHEESTSKSSSLARSANLKAGAILLNRGFRTHAKKRIGSVSGINVGDIFFFRMELCVVGMHAPSMSGIDYMHPNEGAVAVSIVSSGGYDDVDDGDVLIYSGQGGNMYRKDKDLTISDQKLVKGNLALEKSLHQGNDVRVIRGVKDISHPTGKVYIYDGIYRLQESWIEKGKGGYNIFKYKLGRTTGQPQAFTMWKSIQQWKENISSRAGVILPDLTFGAENLPVCLVNEVDGENSHGLFTYSSSLKNAKPINSPQPSKSCSCRGGCQPGDSNCTCIKRNGGALPYTSLGVVLNSNYLIYECGLSCSCPLNCRGRISQAGLKVRLEVFKTVDKGWGLRSWDPIRAGAFICVYAGEVMEKSATRREVVDNYIFDTTRTYKPFDAILRKQNEPHKFPYPLVISSKDVGNVARFMNHSCDPNVYWQPVVRENNNESHLHVALFAIKHIPPMKELTFDYGVVESAKEVRKKNCLCGSPCCRGYYF